MYLDNIEIPIIISLAFIIDLIIGDPHYPVHPIRLIGYLIMLLEKLLYNFKNKYFGGLLLFIFSITITFSIVFFIVFYSGFIHPFLKYAFMIYFIYSFLSTKALASEVMKVYKALMIDDIIKARQLISYLVGRDTDNITKNEIIKASIETLSENFVDGVFAPLFYISIGGVYGGLFYKTVNTLDSMVGYKNDKYKKFGFISAKIDDFINFIPARIASFIFIPITGLFFRKSISKTLAIVKRDRLNHPSPNSAHSEAAFAAILDIQLGGNTKYFGKMINKPFIGDSVKKLEVDDIKKAIKVFYLTTFIAFITLLIIQISILSLKHFF